MSHSESSGSEVHAIILLVLILVAVALRRLRENHLGGLKKPVDPSCHHARCGMDKLYPLANIQKAIENHHL